MTHTKRASLPPGGIVTIPPIDRQTAEAVLGVPLSLEAWQHVENAFEAYGRRLRALKVSKTSRKKDDPQGWNARQTAAVKAIESAMEKIEQTRKRHGDFLDEASDNYSLQTFGYSAGVSQDAGQILDDAFRKMLNAVTITERAEPIEIETPTAATARDMLVRQIYEALRMHGIDARASSGFTLGMLDKPPLLSDLTPFEQFIDALGIGDEKSETAFSAFVRGAISGGK